MWLNIIKEIDKWKWGQLQTCDSTINTLLGGSLGYPSTLLYMSEVVISILGCIWLIILNYGPKVLLTLSAHAREVYSSHFVCVSLCVTVCVCVCVWFNNGSRIRQPSGLWNDVEIEKVSPFNVLEFFSFDLVFKKKLVQVSWKLQLESGQRSWSVLTLRCSLPLSVCV